MAIDITVMAAAVLLLLGIASSKFAARVGMPVLVLFLGVGMLAGSEGLGRIPFENYPLANSLGSVALALILFDGGLRTPLDALALAWRPALALSTVGVLLTSALTGLAAAWVLDLPLPQGLLLGSIVGSTDAAAVFSVLRSSGLKLPDRLAATLEVESGSNDPMAIFLTIALVNLIVGEAGSLADLALLFLVQFGVGALVGVAVGRLAARTINRINLNDPGLYPLLALSFALLAFGLATAFQGSGFLAVYLAGIVLGNSSIVFRAGIFLFHDAAAWLSQIVLFVMLGLLSFPSRLLAVAWEGLLIALVLIVVARPVAVAVAALPFHFRPRELTFLSWVGLKGAVPITLATFPLMAGVPQSPVIFNAVFFVVLISAVTQGWSLPVVARWLRLGRPADPTPALTVEINALRQVDGEIVDYTVRPQARAAGQQLRDLPFPDGVLVTLILRGKTLVMPRGPTLLQSGDHVFVVLHARMQPLIDRLFEPARSIPTPLPAGLVVSFHASSTAGQLQRFFAIALPVPEQLSLAALLQGADGAHPLELGGYGLAAAEEQERVTLSCLAKGSAASG